MVPTLSLESVCGEDKLETAVNTPRSLLACHKVGCSPEEVVYQPRSSFATGKLSKAMVDLRYKYHEKQRQGTCLWSTPLSAAACTLSS
ncbi:hypothetical protein KIPB_013553 [Kipferlia bialata]|uniref:Uncharacterized protein n=1 Tax=Kipferlia bialata TaxID=797122 RepID=A0A9K3GPR0_9EUKA|nr:hypothetical protein KIPB_013553 [Kipferlia bialata]|eukprot:g13553.t1